MINSLVGRKHFPSGQMAIGGTARGLVPFLARSPTKEHGFSTRNWAGFTFMSHRVEVFGFGMRQTNGFGPQKRFFPVLIPRNLNPGLFC